MNPKEETVKLALKKLFNASYFDICIINNLLQLTNTLPDGDTYKMLNSIHCVNYSTMSKEYRSWLFDTVVSMFKFDGFELNKINDMFIITIEKEELKQIA